MPEWPMAGDEYGWRRRPLAGALRLRPPVAHHQAVEGQLLRRHAARARCAVEIGVAEGVSALEMRRVIDPSGTLFLVDPFPTGRLGISLSRLTAHRVVRSAPRGRVIWVRAGSEEAAAGWDRPIDFAFIDADHTFEGVASHWHDWSRHVPVAGKIMLQGARLGEDSWVQPGHGPARFFETAIADAPEWKLVDGAGAAMVVERRAGRFPRRSTQPAGPASVVR
jgi:hypothetical protein